MPVLRAAEPTLPEGRLAVLYDKNKMVRASLLRTASPAQRGCSKRVPHAPRVDTQCCSIPGELNICHSLFFA